MPLARIDLTAGKPPEYRAALGEVVYDSIVSTLNAPEHDRFQIITEHPPGGIVADPSYLGIARSPDVVFVSVTLNQGRTLEQKKAFYAAVADGFNARVGLRREDVVISLVEVPKENWSFGNGIAQYAT
ncbi:MAG TPA: tautomerase family protein [Candidatus Sulfotelmatobacter sp.]|nr:tautomerase family protein [Candidatus Sulfotelmatobacter sp.]